jgi:hypothetical protein
MFPSLTVPPQPHEARICFASFSFSGSPIPTNPEITLTVLPPRPPVERLISTRPRLLDEGKEGCFSVCWFVTVGLALWGKSSPPRAPKGLWPSPAPPSVDTLSPLAMAQLRPVHRRNQRGYRIHRPETNGLWHNSYVQENEQVADVTDHVPAPIFHRVSTSQQRSPRRWIA